MNFLAHAYLTPHDAPPGVLVGNLTADFIKGRARHALPADLQTGIALHRRIDAFTDLHPLVARCADLLAQRWGRYATVLVDILFDHCLASQWPRHSAVALPAFAQHVYATLRQHRHLLPERAQLAVHAMTADDWFGTYATLDGMRLAFSRLTRRLQYRGHDVELAPCVDDFAAHRAAFFAAFEAFFPALLAHARGDTMARSNDARMGWHE